ncbi:MAG: dihydroorotase [Verrucomicrobia bacterium]|nr:MAG: dihydroorotase [Verrucomicrobiota bacterium]
MHNYLWVSNGRVIDPRNKRDAIGDVFAKNGKIVASLSAEEKEVAHRIDAEGLIVCPGFVDVHVHLREPGQTHKENIATGTLAAAAGGVTTVVCMPNTSPCTDNSGTIQLIKDIAQRDGVVNVLTTGTITIGRQGQKLAPIGSLKNAGVVAISDDGECVQNNEIMRRAAEYAKMFDLPIMDHCQDVALTHNAVMNEGEISTKLGLQGWPNAAEDIIVARNIIISTYSGAHIHMQHLSSGYAVDMLRRAKERGVNVSAEVTPHHLALTDDCLKEYNTDFKMNPPLRTERDRQALIEGLLDGTIDIIATDHAPHTNYEKNVEFDRAPFGIIGLETLLPICLEVLVKSGRADMNFFISRLTEKPAQLLKLNKGSLSEGMDADITIFNPEEKWVFTADKIHSRSHNSPWLNKELVGKVHYTFVNGNLVYKGH